MPEEEDYALITLPRWQSYLLGFLCLSIYVVLIRVLWWAGTSLIG